MDNLIGQNIEKIMRIKGIKQTRLARDADMNPAQLNRIIKGQQKSYQMSTLQRIADALGEPLVVITGGGTELINSAVKHLVETHPEDALEFLARPENKGWIALMMWSKDTGMSEEEIQNIVSLYLKIKNKEESSSSTEQ